MKKQEVKKRLGEIKSNLNFARTLTGDEYFVNYPPTTEVDLYTNLLRTHQKWIGTMEMIGKIDKINRPGVLYFTLTKDNFLVIKTDKKDKIYGFTWGIILDNGAIHYNTTTYEIIHVGSYYALVYDTVSNSDEGCVIKELTKV